MDAVAWYRRCIKLASDKPPDIAVVHVYLHARCYVKFQAKQTSILFYNISYLFMKEI